MSISGSDILKAVSLPFRIYNVEKLNIDKFIFTLSFQAIDNCNITIAKKILYLAIEQEKIEKINNSVIPKFNPWAIKIPLNWEINLKGFEKVPEIQLEPLPEISPLKIKPIIFDKNEETLTEPFQIETEIITKMEIHDLKGKKLKMVEEKANVKAENLEKPKEKDLPKKIKKIVKKQKSIDKKQTKLTEKSKKTKKSKKNKKTLMDFM